jgi:type II secretory pathway pseudopilin PulG
MPLPFDASPHGSRSTGFSFAELVIVVGLMATLSAFAVPQILVGVDELRTVGAARYVSTRVQRARMDAVRRSVDVGLQFTQTSSGYTFDEHVDGNGNGLRARDIERGIDPQVWPAERLFDNFSGIDFGVTTDVPAVEAGGDPPGIDPIRLGGSDILSFSALGTSTSGSLYIRSRRGAQYVIRVFGDTGKTRLLKFNPGTRRWLPL